MSADDPILRPPAAPSSPDGDKLATIKARFDSMRESQSKPGLNTLGREARAAIRHNAERELARQDVPWLIEEIQQLRARLSDAEKDQPELARLRKWYDEAITAAFETRKIIEDLRAQLALADSETARRDTAKENA